MDLLERAHSSNHVWKILEHLKTLSSLATFTTDTDFSLQPALACEDAANKISTFLSDKEISSTNLSNDAIEDLMVCSEYMKKILQLNQSLKKKWVDTAPQIENNAVDLCEKQNCDDETAC
eukprot:gene1600-3092_t